MAISRRTVFEFARGEDMVFPFAITQGSMPAGTIITSALSAVTGPDASVLPTDPPGRAGDVEDRAATSDVPAGFNVIYRAADFPDLQSGWYLLDIKIKSGTSVTITASASINIYESPSSRPL